MYYIQEHQLSEELLSKFENTLNQNNQEFQPSQVYNSQTEEKLIKLETRLSKFRTLTDKRLFDTAESLISQINQKQKSKRFLLFKNDVMHIHYEKDGYFKEHEDYLSVTSNVIEEYSLIICINSTCKQRGRTILKINDFYSCYSSGSNTRGGCLLFRKDIPHEGELTDGVKEIISFNVWAVESTVSQVLIVKFQNNDNQKDDNQKDDNQKDDRRYCLSFNNINEYPETLLCTFINSGVGGIKSDPVTEFKCDDTFEDFSIINDIYHGKAISDIALRQHRETLEYYGFDYHKLLIKSFIPLSKQVSNPSMLAIDFDDTIGEPNILLFGDQADYIEYLTKVNEEELPYIPFTVIMAEGKLTYGGEMSDTDPTDIQMSPVFASFTENRNIMFIRNIMGTSVETSEYHDSYEPNFQCEGFENIKIGSTFIAVSEDEFNDNNYEEEKENIDSNDLEEPLHLKILNGDYTLKGKLVNYALNVTTDISNENLIKMITNREFEHEFIKADPGVIDSDAIIKRVEQVKLYDKIKENLNKIAIPNSQRIADSQDEFYCNENVYGNFNLVFIYGFISI